MQQKQQPIQRLYQIYSKLQQKLNNHIAKIQIILDNQSLNQRRLSAEQLQEYESQLSAKLARIKQQIDNALYQFQISTSNNSTIAVKYNILRQSRKEMFQTNTQLKEQLQQIKKKISKSKKLDNLLKEIQNQIRIQNLGVVKMQEAYNNSIKLQKQMIKKLQRIQNRQIRLTSNIQEENQRHNQASEFFETWVKYDKLIAQKNLINKHYDNIDEQFNKKYTSRINQKQQLQQRIKSYNQVYSQLQVSTQEQQLIIKEIMMKQGLTGAQLLSDIKYEYSSDQQAENKDQNQINHRLKKFRRRLGLNNQLYESKISRFRPKNKQRSQTQHVPSLSQQISQLKIKKKLLQQKLQDTHNQMRTTAKKSLKHQKLPATSPIEYKQKNFSSQQILKKSLKVNSLQLETLKKNEDLMLPKLQQSQEEKNKKGWQTKSVHTSNRNQFMPITHNKKVVSYTTTPKHNTSVPSRNSKNIQQQAKSQNSSLFLMSPKNKLPNNAQYDFRIRTKDGYIYNNKNSLKLDDSSSQSSFFQQKSQILKLYDKLSKRDFSSNEFNKNASIQDCTCKKQNSQSNQNQKQKQKDSKQQISVSSQKSLNQLSSYVKLSVRNRKKKKQTSKQMMQSRQSDGQIQKKSMIKDEIITKSLVKSQRQKIDKLAEEKLQKSANQQLIKQKVDKFEQKCQQIRRRLKTIHQKDQQLLNK